MKNSNYSSVIVLLSFVLLFIIESMVQDFNEIDNFPNDKNHYGETAVDVPISENHSYELNEIVANE